MLSLLLKLREQAASSITNYFSMANAITAANKPSGDSNSVAGIVNNNVAEGTWSALVSDSTDNYMAQYTQNTIAGAVLDYIQTSGIPTGVPLKVDIDCAAIGSTSGAEFDLQSSRGWTTSTFLALSSTSRHTITLYGTATISNPDITYYDSSLISGQGVKIYEIRITLV